MRHAQLHAVPVAQRFSHTISYADSKPNGHTDKDSDANGNTYPYRDAIGFADSLYLYSTRGPEW